MKQKLESCCWTCDQDFGLELCKQEIAAVIGANHWIRIATMQKAPNASMQIVE